MVAVIVTRLSFYKSFKSGYASVMKKIVFVWLICVLALVGLFAWLGTHAVASNEEHNAAQEDIHAEFTLATADGKVVKASDLRGHYLLVYFGFTHCPNICPTTLLLISNVLKQLGSSGAEITPIFITVDPERDTPDAAAQYASHFGSSMLGLSGTPEQIKDAADHFKVYYSKVEQKGSALGYVVDHSSFIYLMDKNGNYLAHFASDVPEQELKRELERYVE